MATLNTKACIVPKFGKSSIDLSVFNPASLFKLGDVGGYWDASKSPSGALDAWQDLSGLDNHFTQTTAGKKPVNSGNYLSFDGVDDGMVSPSIDFSNSDQITVIAAVQRDVIGSNRIICELGNDVAGVTAPNIFTMFSSVTGDDWSFRSVTGSAGTTINRPFVNSSQNLGVVVAETDTVANYTRVKFRDLVNETNVTHASAKFSNAPIYLGSRGQASNYYAGRIYALFVIDRTLTNDELSKVTALFNRKVGII